jgi:mannose-6-phosphate isomerase-like protein (cupin superfamily)
MPGIFVERRELPAMSTREAVILEPGGGRAYPMGRIGAVFKADGAETQNQYSISEWWLDPHTQGPGPHSHPEDDTFYIISGTMSVLVGEHWAHATTGTFILVPGGIIHDFENRTGERAGLLNVSVPGAFEPEMPAIAAWFAENPPADA